MTLNQLYALSDRERFPAFHCSDNRPSTLFYADLKVAMAFGIRAVWDTLKRCGDLAEREAVNEFIRNVVGGCHSVRIDCYNCGKGEEVYFVPKGLITKLQAKGK